MIDKIRKFQNALNKGEYVKIITAVEDYTSHIDRTDLIDATDNILEIHRANGAKVAINVDYVVSICVVRRL